MSATRRGERGRGGAVAIAALLLVVVLALAVTFGTEPISLARAWSDPESLDRTIALGVRLPRAALGAIAGAGLAGVGVAFQAILRNPLAEPYVLGVSGGAALGATLALVAGASAASLLGASVVPLAAFVGGLVATALVYALARVASPAAGGTSVLLAGVVVNAIASAGITFLRTIVSATKAQELLFWLMGFLDVPSPAGLALCALYVSIGAALLLADAPRLNLLALGDESAEHLGVDVRALERRTFLVCSLVVGTIVSMTGLIGFVGLIVPHGARRLVGPDVRALLPVSLFGGGAVLVACDLAARVTFRWVHTEPPVGAVTALLGGPMFLVLLRRRVAV